MRTASLSVLGRPDELIRLGGGMEIHKPKPWHGLREFGKEVATIVLGVLIAIGAEQIVEQAHWRHEVEAERAALQNEAQENVTTAAYRVAEQPCVERRLAEIELGFRRQAKGEPTGFRQPVTKPPSWTASSGSWDIAVSGQALGHMPQKEKLAFSEAFDTYKGFAHLRAEEDAIWLRLSLLNHPDILSPGDWVELHQAFGEALGMNARMSTITKYILEDAAMGQHPQAFGPIDSAPLKAFCTSIL